MNVSTIHNGLKQTFFQRFFAYSLLISFVFDVLTSSGSLYTLQFTETFEVRINTYKQQIFQFAYQCGYFTE